MDQGNKPLNFPRFWWGLAWLLVFAVVIGSLARLPEAPMPLPQGFDKYEHVFAYTLLSGYFGQLLADPWRHAKAAAALFFLGGTLELLQGWSGYRSMDTMDLIANSLGIAAGWLACRTPLGSLLYAFDQRVSK